MENSTLRHLFIYLYSVFEKDCFDYMKNFRQQSCDYHNASKFIEEYIEMQNDADRDIINRVYKTRNYLVHNIDECEDNLKDTIWEELIYCSRKVKGDLFNITQLTKSLE